MKFTEMISKNACVFRLTLLNTSFRIGSVLI